MKPLQLAAGCRQDYGVERMRVNHATDILARLIYFRVDKSLPGYMMLALNAPAGKTNFHYFIRIQRFRRNAHTRKE
jgi:hypothetical protein